MVACVVGAVSHLSHSLAAVSVGFFWSPSPPYTAPGTAAVAPLAALACFYDAQSAGNLRDSQTVEVQLPHQQRWTGTKKASPCFLDQTTTSDNPFMSRTVLPHTLSHTMS